MLQSHNGFQAQQQHQHQQPARVFSESLPLPNDPNQQSLGLVTHSESTVAKGDGPGKCSQRSAQRLQARRLHPRVAALPNGDVTWHDVWDAPMCWGLP